MPVRIHHRVARLAVAPAVLLAAALGLIAQSPQPEPQKKTADPMKAGAKTSGPIRLSDGTFLWFGPNGPNANDPDRVLISPLDLQKLNEQIDQLKKQLAARKPVSPSGCAVRAKVEKRGESLVATVQVTYSFRTTTANAPVALGGKRAFPVSAALDGKKVPILETAEDGFAALIEAPGDHTLVVEYEAAVAGRGTKTEIGFELGLPRAAITTLVFEPPTDVKRVNLTTRTPDPTQPLKPAVVSRVSGMEAKQLAPRSGSDTGYPLGPVDSVELTWDPPATGPQAADQVQSAELDVVFKLTERTTETEAKVRLRGTAREWRLIAPANAEVTAARARAGEPGTDVGPVLQPTITHPDPAKLIWKVELPAGSVPADWVLTVFVRQDRPKSGPNPAAVSVGPLGVLDVARQTGTVRVTAAGSVRFEFDHGPELHRDIPTAPADSGTTEALFRLATGPTGRGTLGPLLMVKAHPVAGALRVKPTYRLHLTETAWQVRADVRVTPVRAEIDTLTVEVPANWRSFQAGPPELVAGVQQDENADGPRRTVVIKLAESRRQPFDLEFIATIPVNSGEIETAVHLPLFPSVPHKEGRLEVTERDAVVTAAVGPGLEVRGSAREWEKDQPASWGRPLAPVPGVDGKPPRVVTAVTGRFEHGVARVELAWQPHRPELVADIRTEVTVERRQVRVVQTVKFQAPTGLPRPLRFRGPANGIAGLKIDPSLHPTGPGEWASADDVEPAAAYRIEFAVPLPKAGPDDRGPWKVAVPLFWPADATRSETVARVWSESDGVQIDGVLSGGWRDLPPEPVGDRPALPAATLAGTGTGLTLGLDLRDPDGPGRFVVWVGSGLIRARPEEFGPTDYRARFLIRRWLTDTIEVRVPGPLAGGNPEVLIDGAMKADASTAPDPDDPNGVIVRVPLPDPRLKPVELEVRYKLPVDRGGQYVPPQLRGATFDGPVRWQVLLPDGTVPLLTDGGSAEQRWRFGLGLLMPVAGWSGESLDQWFKTGADGDVRRAGAADELVVRQSAPGPLRVAAVSRAWLLIGSSLTVFLVGLLVSRLRSSLAGPLVALLAGAAAVAAVLFPQPAAQVAGAAQPGLAALVVVLLGLAASRWYHRRRVTHLPGFSRSWSDYPVTPSTPSGTPSARPRPVTSTGSTGSTGSAAEPQPVAPSGG